ncbi:uncharacterized protein LOC131254781 [Magnolia sinica]|uniref:uncharacterized protein LOC131254781 n=1 Tax=Magnolia sinica TaxID=86752 RepID=UPI002659613E|nr:uncharacterized protein LOC131254781 [Magnolia sinica]
MWEKARVFSVAAISLRIRVFFQSAEEMATANPFDLLGDDDNDDLSVESSTEESPSSNASCFSEFSGFSGGDVMNNVAAPSIEDPAIISLKQAVEGLDNLDQSAEILIRFLCAVPGWGEKNVQVQQQVVEIITHIASTVQKFPKRCVVLCILGGY